MRLEFFESLNGTTDLNVMTVDLQLHLTMHCCRQALFRLLNSNSKVVQYLSAKPPGRGGPGIL